MTGVPAVRALLGAVAVTVSLGFLSAGPVWAGEAHVFGVEKFTSAIVNKNGEPATQAGSHPYAMTTMVEFATHVPAEGSIEAESELYPAPNGLAKEVEMSFPTGVIVNPTVTTSKCAEAELDATFECPAASAVGIADIKLAFDEGLPSGDVPVYDMVPPYGVPAEFGFAIKGVGVVVHVVGSTRTGGDYGLSAMTPGILERGYLYSVALTLWGDPTAESHDGERGLCAELGGSCPVERTDAPLLTLPSACTGEPLVASMSADSWEDPARFVTASAELPPVTGCKALGFAPTLSVRPVEPAVAAAESPTALEIDLKIPREESLKGLAESDLKEAEVKLPTGMAVSSSGVNGLEACPLLGGREPQKEAAEGKKELVGINFESKQPADCPAAAMLGSVELITPLLEQPLKGSIYFAQQGNLPGDGSNPFGSLIALYVVAEGGGAIVKFPGDVALDRSTGQVSVSFGEDPTTGSYLPQLPFSELKMRFFGGPHAALVAPPDCGTYTTTSLLTPYGSEAKPLLEPADPTANPASSFTVSEDCGPHGFSPTLTAGTTNPQAGGFSDETVTIARNDREQDLRGVTVTTPPGLLALLSKVPLCQEPGASQGTCGEESKIGETTMAIGPGEDPYWVTGGRVYLTGPYDQQPFGLSIVVPTVAGPLTLTGEHGGSGREVVRASIAVSSKTGALTISTDPFPSILGGVPLDIRTIDVDIDRGEFALNPTNCEEFHVTSAITGADGATATPSSRFQAANCAALAFKPSLSARTQGNASDIGNGASLNIKISQRTGEAAIRSVHLELPKKLPARLHTLQQACRKATFDVNPANCPAASDVGTAIAHTPVLPVPLEGPGYFVSHGGAQYPELVFVLQGDGVTIDLAGETHIGTKTKITSVGFGTVPDAPISSFEASLPEGIDSALAGVTPKGVCGAKSLSMPTTIVGQNGARVKRTTKVTIADCRKKTPTRRSSRATSKRPRRV